MFGQRNRVEHKLLQFHRVRLFRLDRLAAFIHERDFLFRPMPGQRKPAAGIKPFNKPDAKRVNADRSGIEQGLSGRSLYSITCNRPSPTTKLPTFSSAWAFDTVLLLISLPVKSCRPRKSG